MKQPMMMNISLWGGGVTSQGAFLTHTQSRGGGVSKWGEEMGRINTFVVKERPNMEADSLWVGVCRRR